MLSLIAMNIENSRMSQPIEETSQVFLFFFLLLLVRLYLFISQQATSPTSTPSLSSSGEVPPHQAIKELERPFLESDLSLSQSFSSIQK
ncbi:MAG: hypothetical protein EPO39_09860 [Candidatus Manganitrophaceae bacterium]|nr:MAG: hypothetical protein EPO39_09860 [Candidatus Manganitrophaceae bacterium]